MSHSDKLKVLLNNKEIICVQKIKKLKRKMKIIKYFSVTITLSSIIILSIMASSVVLTPAVISVLSIISAILVAIDFKFKFQNKKYEKKKLIEMLSKIQNKLEYVNSCNGNLTEQEFLEIFKEFNQA